MKPLILDLTGVKLSPNERLVVENISQRLAPEKPAHIIAVDEALGPEKPQIAPGRQATAQGSRIQISPELKAAWKRGDDYTCQLAAGLPPFGPGPVHPYLDDDGNALMRSWVEDALRVNQALWKKSLIEAISSTHIKSPVNHNGWQPVWQTPQRRT